MNKMDIPKGFARKNLGDELKEILKDDKVKVVVVNEEREKRRVWTINCQRHNTEIHLELDKRGDPKRIMGCDRYREYNGQCSGGERGCMYVKWRELKPYSGK